MEEEKKEDSLQKIVEEFMKEVIELQKKYQLSMRPIITKLGPDIEFTLLKKDNV